MRLIKFINSLLPKSKQNNKGIVGQIASAALSIGDKAAKNGGSGTSGLGQILGNIGNRDVKNKTAKAGMNIMDFGGGFSNTLAAFGIDIFGKEDEVYIPAPNYYTDPNYVETQSYLSALGKGILGGEIPSYYSDIGKTGGVEFEDMLGIANRNAAMSSMGASVKKNRGRGGLFASGVAKSVADTSSKARFTDYGRAMEGREYLLGTGLGVTKGVVSSAQTEQERKNARKYQNYAAAYKERNYDDVQEAEQDQQTGQFLGTLVSMASEYLKNRK